MDQTLRLHNHPLTLSIHALPSQHPYICVVVPEAIDPPVCIGCGVSCRDRVAGIAHSLRAAAPRRGKNGGLEPPLAPPPLPPPPPPPPPSLLYYTRRPTTQDTDVSIPSNRRPALRDERPILCAPLSPQAWSAMLPIIDMPGGYASLNGSLAIAMVTDTVQRQQLATLQSECPSPHTRKEL
jgi:hypothetical protein